MSVYDDVPAPYFGGEDLRYPLGRLVEAVEFLWKREQAREQESRVLPMGVLGLPDDLVALLQRMEERTLELQSDLHALQYTVSLLHQRVETLEKQAQAREDYITLMDRLAAVYRRDDQYGVASLSALNEHDDFTF